MADRAGGALHIRAGGPGDAAMLAALGERTFRGTYAADIRTEDVDAHIATSYRPEQITATLAEAGSHYLIAEVDTGPVGFVPRRTTSATAGSCRTYCAACSPAELTPLRRRRATLVPDGYL
jgi:hypothetical protein